MDPVVIVSGNWAKKNRYVFSPDSRGSIVLNLDEATTLDELVKSVFDDYGVNGWSHQIQLSYMFSSKTLKRMPHDTPPVYVSNDRQLQGFMSLRKIDQLRLCVEITERTDTESGASDGFREKRKMPPCSTLEAESTDYDYGRSEDGYSYSYCDDNRSKSHEERDLWNEDCGSKNRDEEDEEQEEEEDEQEEDEFDSRFDMFDDSDGASSEDDNFSSYGESPPEAEDSPTLPSNKRPQNMATCLSKRNPEDLRLELSKLSLAVGQRYESKADFERRLKLLTLRDGFDFDVPVSNPELVIAKCWVDGCRWRVRASTQGDSPAFHVRIYESEHTCSVTERSNRCRQATPDILGELYRNFLGDVGPTVRPKSVAVTFSKHYGIKVTTMLRLT